MIYYSIIVILIIVYLLY